MTLRRKNKMGYTSAFRWTLMSVMSIGMAILIGCAQSGVPVAKPGEGLESLDLKDSRITASQAKTLVIAVVSDATRRQLTGATLAQANSAPYETFLTDLERQHGVNRIADWPLASLSAWCLLLESENRFPPQQLFDRLAADVRIDAVHQVNLFQLVANRPNNDPHRRLQQNIAELNVESAHRFATGAGVTVGVIDTGVDIRHPELASQVVDSRNFVDRDDDAFVDDVHGTVVASIIAAHTNNAEGIIGIAPDASLVALKACWQQEPGFDQAVCSTYTLAKALDHAIAQGVDVINLSLRGPEDALLQAILTRAQTKNIWIIGAHADEPGQRFPSASNDVIAVAQSAQPGAIAAPGARVLAARPNGQYDYFSGASIAVAHVSGIAALMRERKPHLTTQGLRDLLTARTSLDVCDMLAELVHAEC